jgi:hypothetical protein
MIDDGSKEIGRDDVVVQDISMHLLDALEAGERRSAAGLAASGAGSTPAPSATEPVE